MQAELKTINIFWGEAQQAAQDRQRWRVVVKALCPNWDHEYDMNRNMINKLS